MSLQEKYPYPPYKDKKTELAQVSGQGKDKAGYTFRDSRSWILSTSHEKFTFSDDSKCTLMTKENDEIIMASGACYSLNGVRVLDVCHLLRYK